MLGYKAKSISLFHGPMNAEAFNKAKLSKHHVAFVCEGRPSLESGRKTAALLLKKGLTPTMVSDNMAGFLFFKGLVSQVNLACQHADSQGALCDVGALILAVLAKKHKVPVKLLPAQRRHRFLGDPKAILSFEGKRMAPQGTRSYVPLVEWVPAKYLK